MTLYNIFVYGLICALIYLCTCVKERKASLKFLHKFYIWRYKDRSSADLAFDANGTGWVCLQISVILTQPMGNSICEWPIKSSSKIYNFKIMKYFIGYGSLFFFYIKHLHARVNIKFTITSHISTMIYLGIKNYTTIKL